MHEFCTASNSANISSKSTCNEFTQPSLLTASTYYILHVWFNPKWADRIREKLQSAHTQKITVNWKKCKKKRHWNVMYRHNENKIRATRDCFKNILISFSSWNCNRICKFSEKVQSIHNLWWRWYSSNPFNPVPNGCHTSKNLWIFTTRFIFHYKTCNAKENSIVDQRRTGIAYSLTVIKYYQMNDKHEMFESKQSPLQTPLFVVAFSYPAQTIRRVNVLLWILLQRLCAKTGKITAWSKSSSGGSSLPDFNAFSSRFSYPSDPTNDMSN